MYSIQCIVHMMFVRRFEKIFDVRLERFFQIENLNPMMGMWREKDLKKKMHTKQAVYLKFVTHTLVVKSKLCELTQRDSLRDSVVTMV